MLTREVVTGSGSSSLVLFESVPEAAIEELVQRARQDGNTLPVDAPLSLLGVEMTHDIVADIKTYFIARGIWMLARLRK